MNSFHIQLELFGEFGSYHIPTLLHPSCLEDDFHFHHGKIYKCKFFCSKESEKHVFIKKYQFSNILKLQAYAYYLIDSVGFQCLLGNSSYHFGQGKQNKRSKGDADQIISNIGLVLQSRLQKSQLTQDEKKYDFIFEAKFLWISLIYGKETGKSQWK